MVRVICAARCRKRICFLWRRNTRVAYLPTSCQRFPNCVRPGENFFIAFACKFDTGILAVGSCSVFDEFTCRFSRTSVCRGGFFFKSFFTIFFYGDWTIFWREDLQVASCHHPPAMPAWTLRISLGNPCNLSPNWHAIINVGSNQLTSDSRCLLFLISMQIMIALTPGWRERERERERESEREGMWGKRERRVRERERIGIRRSSIPSPDKLTRPTALWTQTANQEDFFFFFGQAYFLVNFSFTETEARDTLNGVRKLNLVWISGRMIQLKKKKLQALKIHKKDALVGLDERQMRVIAVFEPKKGTVKSLFSAPALIYFNPCRTTGAKRRTALKRGRRLTLKG